MKCRRPGSNEETKPRMKNKLIYITATALAYAGSVDARELKQGTIELSGDGGLYACRTVTTREGSPDATNQTRSISLDGFYYFAQDVAVGASLISSRDEVSTTTGPFGTRQTIAGPALQWVLPDSKNIAVKLSAFAGVGSSKSWAPNVESTSADISAWVLSAGLSYWVSPAISINTTLSHSRYYYHYPFSPKETADTNALRVGLSFYLE